MKKYILTLLLPMAFCTVWGQTAKDSTAVKVSGKIHVGISTELNTDQDQIDLDYVTNDPRLGTNSGNHYFSDINDVSQNVHTTYGADLKLDLRPNHTLDFSFEGTNDREHAMGSRIERITDTENNMLSSVKGQYNHPDERTNELTAALDYTCRLRRPGSSLTMGYRYRWENESAGVEQLIHETTGWSLFQENILEQKYNTHFHHAHLDYVLPAAKGHLLDFGVAYDRREISVRTEQYWDNIRIQDTDYRHLMQYGGAYARYRMKVGPVEAMARLEYRATRMQQRWLHDVLPTASIRYNIDSVHSLSAFYTIVLIRPDAQYLDSTHITDAYTTHYGNNQLIGMHIHNVALTYRMHFTKADASLEARYIHTTDGFNAIWMERADQRIYTWRNEGVRHAVSITPTIDAKLSQTTNMHAHAIVMWDERVAGAINLVNANWGIRANMRLVQQLLAIATPSDSRSSETLRLNLVARGDYAFHNTLDVYSYAGHGGAVGADLEVAILRALNMSIGYTCMFKPDVHIRQGAYVGSLAFRPGATHVATIQLSYKF